MIRVRKASTTFLCKEEKQVYVCLCVSVCVKLAAQCASLYVCLSVCVYMCKADCPVGLSLCLSIWLCFQCVCICLSFCIRPHPLIISGPQWLNSDICNYKFTNSINVWMILMKPSWTQNQYHTESSEERWLHLKQLKLE